MKIEVVTRQDIQRLHHDLRHTKYEANRTLALLSKMFNLAELWGLRADNTNPCRHVQRYRELHRERFFTDDELMRLGQALTSMENELAILRGVAHAVRLLALTGCRMSEILGLKWAQVDMTAGTFRLEDAKSGARTVILNDAALETLAELPRDSDWVVGGAKAGKPLSAGTLEHSFQRIRERAGISNARLHDLRHTVGTYAAQFGANAYVIRDTLGHKSAAVTDRYVARATDPQRVVSNQIGNRIAAAMSGQKAEIIHLSKKSVA
jgi:integrase